MRSSVLDESSYSYGHKDLALTDAPAAARRGSQGVGATGSTRPKSSSVAYDERPLSGGWRPNDFSERPASREAARVSSRPSSSYSFNKVGSGRPGSSHTGSYLP